MEVCPFCTIERALLIDTPLVIAFFDAYPASPGHALVVPRRHIADYFDCTDEEKAALWAAVDRVREMLAVSHRPDGFNIGINVGAAAGQTVFHCHVHVIPRHHGDVPDPRGGVRHAVMGRGRPS